MRRQRPIQGGRDPLPACVIRDIKTQVERVARRNDVSKSFVIAVALADAFGITEQERYDRDPAPAAKPAKRGKRA